MKKEIALKNLCSVVLISFCLCGSVFAQKPDKPQEKKLIQKLRFFDVLEVRKLPGTKKCTAQICTSITPVIMWNFPRMD